MKKRVNGFMRKEPSKSGFKKLRGIRVFFAVALLFSLFAEATSLEQVFINLNNKINPGVVSISVTKKVKDSLIQVMPGFYVPGAPKINSAGSGFVIDKKGIIVTNSHVVSGADTIEVHFKDDKKSYSAKLLGSDKLSDIALLKINVKFELQPLKLGNSSQLQVGEWVAAFGNPHGYAHTVTKGIISGVKREIDDLNLFPLLQTDASINQGNSGGPLVNLKGEVVGVNNAIAAGAQGISFAIPIDNVKNILQDILKYGYVRRGFIGVMLGYTPNIKGALVTDIVPESPAKEGGIKRGDLITQFQDAPVERPKDLVSAVAKTPINSKAIVEILRNGKKKKLTVTVRPVQKDTFAFTVNKNEKQFSFAFGFEVINSNANVLRQFRLPDMGAQHPIVTRVDASSPAGKAGLKSGDLIFKANGKKVYKAQSLKKLLKEKEPNTLQILRYHYLYDQYLVFSIQLP